MPEKDRVKEVFYAVIKERNEASPADEQVALSTDAVLFGKGGSLDSLGLVSLILSLEEEISDAFDVSLTLASERAMSAKHSPFRTVGALIDFTTELLVEEESESSAQTRPAQTGQGD